MLIAVEGIDGSGKSTLAKALAHELHARGHDIRLMDKDVRRPIRCTYSALCKSANDFPSALASLFLALGDFIWTREHQPMARSEIWLWDRYVYSALADSLALGVSPLLVQQLSQVLPESALTILVSVPAQLARSRKKSISLAEAGGPEFLERYGSPELAFEAFQTSVSEGYLYLERHGALGKRVVIIDGSQPTSELHRSAVNALLA